MQPLLNIGELSRLIRRAEQTIRNDLKRNPAAVPPSIRIPGSRARRWRQEAVDTWVQSLEEAPPAVKRGRGRPRKRATAASWRSSLRPLRNEPGPLARTGLNHRW